MNTQWVPIPGMEGYYASASGLIGSEWVPTRTGRKKTGLIKPVRFIKNNHGYFVVNITPIEEGRRRIYTAHSLIARTFIGERPDGLQVCHFDGDRTNNKIENLRYGTPKENGEDKVRHGRSTPGERNNTTKLTEDAVRAIRRVANNSSGINQVELARQYGVSPSTISLILKNRIWRHIIED